MTSAPIPARPISAAVRRSTSDNNTPYEYGDDPVANGARLRQHLPAPDDVRPEPRRRIPAPTTRTSSSCTNAIVAQRLGPARRAACQRATTDCTRRPHLQHRSARPSTGGDDQTDSSGLNAFAIWVYSNGANAAGLRPRCDGGVLPAARQLRPRSFYLAQLEAVHAASGSTSTCGTRVTPATCAPSSASVADRHGRGGHVQRLLLERL